MPIYAYRCDECGFSKDVLQKISDPVLTVCLSCGKSAFQKQVTAAGFQLKGSGWYATDFKDSNKAPSAASSTVPAPAESAGPATSSTTSVDSPPSPTKAESSSATSSAKDSSTQ